MVKLLWLRCKRNFSGARVKCGGANEYMDKSALGRGCSIRPWEGGILGSWKKEQWRQCSSNGWAGHRWSDNEEDVVRV